MSSPIQKLQNPLLSPPQSKHPSRSHSTNPNNANNIAAPKWVPSEERLQKAWRGLGTTVASCLSKAEKAATAKNAATNTSTAATTTTVISNDEKEKTKRELDDCAALFLRTRREFHRLLSHVEAKLQGKAEEMESLETYVRTQPRIGSARGDKTKIRKRKR
jgi:hypothetical protein